jgi:DNA-directed RNA polymerase subunit RPC12/RpoP
MVLPDLQPHTRTCALAALTRPATGRSASPSLAAAATGHFVQRELRRGEFVPRLPNSLLYDVPRDSSQRVVGAVQEANARLKRGQDARAAPHTSKCCLCGDTFKGYEDNAQPVRNEGVACDECNTKIVLPQRFRKWRD